MWRIFTPVMLTVGMVVQSCNQVEEKPKIQKPLAYSQWVISGYVPSVSDVPKFSPITYQLDFINDSTFILHLDINRIVGRYTATTEGGFRVIEKRQTNSCCDSEYALQLADIFIQAQSYQETQEGISLHGTGELFLREKIGKP
jgi:hypothetical protein